MLIVTMNSAHNSSPNINIVVLSFSEYKTLPTIDFRLIIFPFSIFTEHEWSWACWSKENPHKYFEFQKQTNKQQNVLIQHSFLYIFTGTTASSARRGGSYCTAKWISAKQCAWLTKIAIVARWSAKRTTTDWHRKWCVHRRWRFG